MTYDHFLGEVLKTCIVAVLVTGVVSLIVNMLREFVFDR